MPSFTWHHYVELDEEVIAAKYIVRMIFVSKTNHQTPDPWSGRIF